MNDPTTYLLQAVERFLDRTDMAPARLGRESLGDPSFVHGLRRGRAPRLDTADRLLVFLGERPVGPDFRREVEAFLGVTGIKPYLFGASAAGNPSFVQRLLEGCSPRLGTVGRVRAWMERNCSVADRREILALAGIRSGDSDAVMEGGVREGMTTSKEGTMHETEDEIPAHCDCSAGAMRTINQPMRKTMTNQVTHEEAPYLSTTGAATFLGLSPRTLDRYRVTGEGPAFFRFGGRIRYRREDLEDWAGARRMSSTSDGRHPSRRDHRKNPENPENPENPGSGK
ncbi:MAG: helix-turn-helix domain-containing protein [Gammaproteobacteria bacterium]|nr:helix-turn-helix domain-containing protein [Gammaproteobacteria bacterium]